MVLIRSATHAGSWYSSDPIQLSQSIDRWLQSAQNSNRVPEEPLLDPINNLNDCDHALIQNCRAIIAPHAGYSYSGSTAAWAYKSIKPEQIKNVFILGPSHHLYLNRCALSGCTTYQTPLVNEELRSTGQFSTMDLKTDEDEHSIELHLPFIKHIFKNQHISIIPILVGSIDFQSESNYAKILSHYLKQNHNLFIISSDFCHWGIRFSYTYYQEPSQEPIKSLNRNQENRKNNNQQQQQILNYPIYKSIQRLDRKAIEIISTNDNNNDDDVDDHHHYVSNNHLKFNQYLMNTKNTICGRHPIGILLGILNIINNNQQQDDDDDDEQEQEHDNIKGARIKFNRYHQSSLCLNINDSSVSYASGYLTLF